MKRTISPSDHDDPANVLRAYCAEMAHRVLSVEEQQALGEAISAGRRAAFHLSALPPAAPERSALGATVHAAMEARERLLLHHLRLVISVAVRYDGRGVPLPDLIQEGNLGLMHAIDKFEPERGHKFGTYATWWVLHYVRRAIANQGRAVRLPVFQHRRVGSLMGKLADLRADLQREPGIEEIAAATGLTPEEALEALEWGQSVYSLDWPLNDAPDSGVFGDVVPDECDVEAEALGSVTARELAEVLEELTPAEARVLILRFGLRDGEERTLEEVGRRIGKTKQRVEQIEKDALRRLRAPSRSKSLRSFL
jgi:RNA polymerase primary sigma factor